jgi:hypothetical protein
MKRSRVKEKEARQKKNERKMSASRGDIIFLIGELCQVSTNAILH